jgi:hypothetical protein
MAGPVKANSEASNADSGVAAASKAIELEKVDPSKEEHDQCAGTIGCTTRAAKRAYASQR